MEERNAGYYVDVINFSIHTTFDLAKEPEIEVFIAHCLTIPGVVDLTLKRYSLEVEVGFLFDIHSIKAAAVELFKSVLEPDEMRKIPTRELAERAAQRQRENMEDFDEAASLPNLLMAMMDSNDVSEA